MIGRPKDRVIVASEKADFVADRIAAGMPAPEIELRKLARYLREIVADMEPKGKAIAASPAEPRLRGEPSSWRRRAEGAAPSVPARSAVT